MGIFGGDGIYKFFSEIQFRKDSMYKRFTSVEIVYCTAILLAYF